MPKRSLEPEMEAFLLRVVPGLAHDWQGASEDEIAQMERIAGEPLPRFYRWFLSTMGRSRGKLYGLDVSIETALRVNQPDFGDDEDDGYCEEDEDSDYLRIGFIPEGGGPGEDAFAYYDLERPCRDDALVLAGYTPLGETFREVVAGWAMEHVLGRHRHRCAGHWSDHGRYGADVGTQLRPVLAELGFSSPIPTGNACGIFERADAAIHLWANPKSMDDKGVRGVIFRLAANKPSSISAIFDAIAKATYVGIELIDDLPSCGQLPATDEQVQRWSNAQKQQHRDLSVDKAIDSRRRARPAASPDEVGALDVLLVSADPADRERGLDMLYLDRDPEEHLGALGLLANRDGELPHIRARARRLLEPYTGLPHYGEHILDDDREQVVRALFESWMSDDRTRLKVDGPVSSLPGLLADYPLEEVEINKGSFEQLPAVLFRLPKLRSLETRNSEVGSYAGLGRLSGLGKLRLHRLPAVPAEIERLDELEYLKLNMNELAELPPELCELGRLQHLNVSDNKLTRLPECIGELPLVVLRARSNQLASLPESLALCRSLEDLELAPTKLPHESLQALVNWFREGDADDRTRRLHWNLVLGKVERALELADADDLTAAVESPLDSVRIHASIALGRIDGSSDDPPPDPARVTDLFMTYQMSSDDEVRSAPRAELLEIGNDELKSFIARDGELEGVIGHYGKTIDEQTCRLFGLDPMLVARRLIGELAGSGALSYLMVHGEREDRLAALRSIIFHDYHLYQENISTLCEELGEFQALTEIKLRATSIAELPESIGQLDKLCDIEIRGSKLKALPASVSRLSKLERVVVTESELCAFPEALLSLPGLQVLRLEDNAIPSLPDDIVRMKGLRELNLAKNQIRVLPDGLRDLPYLTSLNLARNPLGTVPEVLCRMPELEKLVLDGCQITSLPEHTRKLESVVDLCLSHNLFTSFPEVLYDMPWLQVLRLGHGQLEELPEHIERLPNLQVLALWGNKKLRGNAQKVLRSKLPPTCKLLLKHPN